MSELAYAGFTLRIRALLLDTVISLSGIVTVALLAGSYERLAPYLLTVGIPLFLFQEPILVILIGGSPGHRLVGVRVIHARTGASLSILRSLLRWITQLFLGLPSFLLIATTSKSQAIHDWVAGSAVIVDAESAQKFRESGLAHAERVSTWTKLRDRFRSRSSK